MLLGAKNQAECARRQLRAALGVPGLVRPQHVGEQAEIEVWSNALRVPRSPHLREDSRAVADLRGVLAGAPDIISPAEQPHSAPLRWISNLWTLTHPGGRPSDPSSGSDRLGGSASGIGVRSVAVFW